MEVGVDSKATNLKLTISAIRWKLETCILWKNGVDTMRSIRIGVPSGKAKMVMWEGTEDEKSFEIKSLKRGTPYIVAYGVKYELTEEEINQLRFMQKVASVSL